MSLKLFDYGNSFESVLTLSLLPSGTKYKIWYIVCYLLVNDTYGQIQTSIRNTIHNNNQYSGSNYNSDFGKWRT